jgi:hypothetical protein
MTRRVLCGSVAIGNFHRGGTAGAEGFVGRLLTALWKLPRFFVLFA